jgi:hypothetical protein
MPKASTYANLVWREYLTKNNIKELRYIIASPGIHEVLIVPKKKISEKTQRKFLDNFKPDIPSLWKYKISKGPKKYSSKTYFSKTKISLDDLTINLRFIPNEEILKKVIESRVYSNINTAYYREKGIRPYI